MKISLDKLWVPPKHGITPNLTSGCPNIAFSDAILISQLIASSHPPPNAYPLTAAITVFSRASILSRLVGTGIAKELIFTGRQVNAEEAKSIGLINKVVPSDLLLEESMKMMKQIVEKAPIAIRYAKVVINKGIDMDLKNALELEKDIAGLTFATRDKKEVINSFIENRKPIIENKSW